MPPRDSYDTLLREFAAMRRRLDKLERHKHPVGRNDAASDRTFILAFANTYDPSTPYQDGITTHIFDEVSESNGDLSLDGLGHVVVGSDGVYRTLTWAGIQSGTSSTSSTNLLRIEYNAGTDFARSGYFQFNSNGLFVANAAALVAGDLIGVTLNNRTGSVRTLLSTAGILVERVDA